MKKKNIPASVASTNAYEGLEDWARSRVQVWLQELLEDEVTQFLGREKSERSPNRRGYRNGHGKPRRFAMMNGTMEVRRPRVRKALLHGSGRRFRGRRHRRRPVLGDRRGPNGGDVIPQTPGSRFGSDFGGRCGPIGLTGRSANEYADLPAGSHAMIFLPMSKRREVAPPMPTPIRDQLAQQLGTQRRMVDFDTFDIQLQELLRMLESGPDFNRTSLPASIPMGS